MPIAYTCPHCGKSYSVAEQYAGQSGPCAACGKPITIPLAAAGTVYASMPPKPERSSGMGLLVVAVVVGVLSIPCVLAILVALLLPAVQAAREAARRAQSTNNAKQILLALHNYHDVHGSFPPAVVTDAGGKPLYSGRVLLLPYLEQNALYNSFDLTEPWNSSANMRISQTTIPTFVDPANPNSGAGQTDYLFVTGTGTVFEDGKATKLKEITDGTSNTIVLVEMRNSGISWAEPRDIDLTQTATLPAGNHPGINIVGLADGSVRSVSKNVAPGIISAMATKAGNENVTLP